jgi:hypothetical protein
MFFPKLKTVPSTPFSQFVRSASSGEKKKAYVAALKKASDVQNSVIERSSARRERTSR